LVYRPILYLETIVVLLFLLELIKYVSILLSKVSCIYLSIFGWRGLRYRCIRNKSTCIGIQS